jgi:hypothetical protein
MMTTKNNPEIKIVRQVEAQKWGKFVLSHPWGQIFHTPEMFEVFSRARGHHPTFWGAVNSNGQLLALFLPIRIQLTQPWLQIMAEFTCRAVSYADILCVPGEAGKTALSAVLTAYLAQDGHLPLFTEIRNLSDTQEIQPILQEHGFVYSEHLNYLIDIKKSPEEVFQNIGARTRKNIQRGIKQGIVTVREGTTLEDVKACYAILQQTYKAAHVPLADSSLFEAAFEVLSPKGMIRFTLACIGETAVACSIDLLYKDVIYGWYGGVDREYSRFVPNEILTWRILEWGAKQGYAVYDFGGAGKPNEFYGPRAFKAKFGGALVNFGRNTCVHRPLRLKISEVGYSLLRTLF